MKKTGARAKPNIKRARPPGKAIAETAYLIRSPANARRLLAAMRSLEAGKGKVRKLKEA